MGNSFIDDPIAPYLGTWSSDINAYSILFRIFLAAALAALIGCERSSKRHSAGLRTFILVSMSSAVAAMVDLAIMSYNKENFAAISAASVVSVAMITVQFAQPDQGPHDFRRIMGQRNYRARDRCRAVHDNVHIIHRASAVHITASEN